MAASIPDRISRRGFVKSGLAVMGLAVIPKARCESDGQGISNDSMSMRWALLSDVHIPEDVTNNYRGFFPYKNLEIMVPQLVSYAPDAVAITGDLARLTGQIGDYQNLKKLLTPLLETVPVYMSLGNHDDRDNFLKVFETLPEKRQSVPGKYVVVSEKPPVRVIMLDSLLYTDKVQGLLGKTQRKWLAEYLSKADEMPTVLCFHHTIGDDDGDLLDIPRLYDIIAPVSKVKAVIFGHSHVYSFSEYKGIHQINLPAAGYNFSDHDPVGWVEVRWTAIGAEFLLHATAGNQDKDRAVTRLIWRP